MIILLIGNMTVIRVCFVFVFVVCSFSNVAGTPIFARFMLCDLFCEDDVSTSTTTSSSSDEEYDRICDFYCPIRTTTTPRPALPANPMPGTGPDMRVGGMNMGSQAPFNFVLPQGQPMNVTMQNRGSDWMMNVMTSGMAASPSSLVPRATAAPATATAAPASPAPKDAVAAAAEAPTTAVVASPTTAATPVQ